MRIINKAEERALYHDSKGYFITVDCKVECLHCSSSDDTCDHCNGHRWLWGSTYYPGYGFTPYTLSSICF